MPPPGSPAEAFAKGGDSEEHLGGILSRLQLQSYLTREEKTKAESHG
jgi:hypothetical protein